MKFATDKSRLLTRAIAVLILSCSFIASCGKQLASERHDLALEPQPLSFGDLTSRDGATPLLTSLARNVSTKAISIQGVSVGCGCVSAKLSDRTLLQPGESVPLTLMLQLDRMQEGEHVYQVTVFGESRVLARTVVTYNYQPLIAPTATDMNFGDVPRTQLPLVRTMQVRVGKRLRATVLTAESSGQIGAQIDNPIGGGLTDPLLRVTLPVSLRTGTVIQDRVLIKHGDDASATATVTVRARIRPPFFLEPSVIILTGGTTVAMERIVNLVAEDAGARITAVRLNQSGLKAEVANGGREIRVVASESMGELQRFGSTEAMVEVECGAESHSIPLRITWDVGSGGTARR